MSGNIQLLTALDVLFYSLMYISILILLKNQNARMLIVIAFFAFCTAGLGMFLGLWHLALISILVLGIALALNYLIIIGFFKIGPKLSIDKSVTKK